ncbi:phosphatase PAP2 family protein [Nocardioides daphniae]|uniref:Inositol phosphorylceramide synthase n=1 Tax=Nocardioides daphniae TaxID=402297 RepID=A0A4P7UCE2_9ACTN|nr:phosphatase PAP2 family protein [Nocardioides daphniae]QCC77191.1 inositol phosphorylceramide synthase [Nocardioides daphniae]
MEDEQGDGVNLRPVEPRTPGQGVGASSGWRSRPLYVRAALEVGLVLVLFGIYKIGRQLVADQVPEAMRHADMVRSVQANLWLPSEAAIQASVHVELLMRAANVYYTSVHFPLMVVFLAWGFLRRTPAEYRWARNLVVIQTGAALAIHVFFPLAPPRMFPEWGFVDTMERYGPSPYEGVSGDVANQFAAMPSLHVGWAVLIAYVVYRTGPRWWAYVAATHALLTAVIVVITANHWWLDGFVGIALLVVAVLVLPSPHAEVADSAPASEPVEEAAAA